MNDDPSALEYTGERMVPERASGRTFWEHLGRYRFARKFARGRRVLDIACGEGYGAAALAKAGAASVIGVDLSAEACEHARSKYGLDARSGDALAIPLPDRSLDLVVSFETIEHVDDPAAFLDECARVLAPDGVLIVSTPNRPVYSAEGAHNPFHRIECDEREFEDLLRPRFKTVRLFTQFPESSGWWSLRGLAAERSPWLRIKGFWRLSTWLCPAKRREVDPAIRNSAVDVIQTDEPFASALFSPYVVRPRSPWSRERPYYLIAVAEGVNPPTG
ncbi:Methyltransferase domain-containing protein [Singulisphaera sp. GP187]|uniref:class I SAM-dependent methyltransferase n=1 Tax=Singulisphaera sp. GP187 TaxID=1882752 RepID=UPI00092C3F10|nr:class I SAM-dependent methyltransferase [Singulisphaera sp. GP187]SIO66876.1 Methyltransferase domain-containing protein [Singulisphaera sp. GP187]